MNIRSFETEIKKIDSHLSIRVNPKVPELSGIYYNDSFLLGVPSNQIFDNIREEYGLVSFSGKFMRHRTRPEALAMLRHNLHQINTNPDERDAILGIGEYSADKLDPRKE